MRNCAGSAGNIGRDAIAKRYAGCHAGRRDPEIFSAPRALFSRRGGRGGIDGPAGPKWGHGSAIDSVVVGAGRPWARFGRVCNRKHG